MYHTSVGSRTTGSTLLAIPTSTTMAVNSVPPSRKTSMITLLSIPCQPAEGFSLKIIITVFYLNDSRSIVESIWHLWNYFLSFLSSVIHTISNNHTNAWPSPRRFDLWKKIRSYHFTKPTKKIIFQVKYYHLQSLCHFLCSNWWFGTMPPTLA